MAELFGASYSRADLLRRVGDFRQVAGMREYAYTSGRADGVRAIEVDTGAFRFEALPGRCLDIAAASYRGVPLGYVSKSGLRHPAYFDEYDPAGCNANFLGGVLTTCGLHNIGPARDADGRRQGQHGRLSAIPAECIATEERWDGDECTFTVRGEMRHSSFYGEDLVLRRRITAALGGASFRIDDEVENLDFAPSPCVVLYHVQFGFPLLDEDSVLFTSPARDCWARAGSDPEAVGRCHAFAAPTDGALESCLYHDLTPDVDGWAAACLYNPRLGGNGLGVYVRYRTDTLPFLVQWKLLRSREYVCGLEPASARLDGEDTEASSLAPLATRRFALEIGVVEGEDACRRVTGL